MKQKIILSMPCEIEFEGEHDDAVFYARDLADLLHHVVLRISPPGGDKLTSVTATVETKKINITVQQA